MPITPLPAKTIDEDVPVTFSFGSYMDVGEVISGTAVTASVFSGEDPSPESMLLGIPSVSGNIVTQVIQGGVLGVIYSLVCVVTTSNSHVFTKEKRLAVTAPGGTFGQGN